MREKDYKKEIQKVADEKNRDYLIKLSKEWVVDHKDGLFLGCYKNKLNEDTVALYSYGVVYLLSGKYSTIMYAPKLLFHKIGQEILYIDDILTKDLSIGNGAALMRALFKYAQLNGYTKIQGFLSEVDMDHKERLLSFYNKFDFQIINNKLFKTLGEF